MPLLINYIVCHVHISSVTATSAHPSEEAGSTPTIDPPWCSRGTPTIDPPWCSKGMPTIDPPWCSLPRASSHLIHTPSMIFLFLHCLTCNRATHESASQPFCLCMYSFVTPACNTRPFLFPPHHSNNRFQCSSTTLSDLCTAPPRRWCPSWSCCTRRPSTCMTPFTSRPSPSSTGSSECRTPFAC